MVGLAHAQRSKTGVCKRRRFFYGIEIAYLKADDLKVYCFLKA